MVVPVAAKDGAAAFVEQDIAQFAKGPGSHLFALQRSFITQIEAFCMLYLLVRVREMPRDGCTTVLTHL